MKKNGIALICSPKINKREETFFNAFGRRGNIRQCVCTKKPMQVNSWGKAVSDIRLLARVVGEAKTEIGGVPIGCQHRKIVNWTACIVSVVHLQQLSAARGLENEAYLHARHSSSSSNSRVTSSEHSEQ